jgi:hypothetical protein
MLERRRRGGRDRDCDLRVLRDVRGERTNFYDYKKSLGSDSATQDIGNHCSFPRP